MYFCQISPHSFPYINLFDSIRVDNCIHFQRTPDEHIAFFIVNGDMYLMEDGIHYHLQEGDWLQLEPGKEHVGYNVSEHCTYFYIHFHMDGFAFLERDESIIIEQLSRNRMQALQGKRITEPIVFPKLFHTKNHIAYNSILETLNQGRQYFNGYKEFCDIQTSCLLLDLFVHLSRSFAQQMLSNEEKSIKQSTFIVHQLLKEINYNYAEKFSSSLIESKFSCNFDYINRIFKKETGQTIFSYLTKVRISQAKMLLTSSNLKIKTIALRVGYEDIYYFSNVFKKETGFSPSHFRKMTLEN